MQPALPFVTAIIPAAGVGSRMKSSVPKQYLKIGDKTVLEHTVERILQYENIDQVIVAVSAGDPYYDELSIAKNERVIRVDGGKERADSVLSALDYLFEVDGPGVDESHINWVMVHDAARPCVDLDDIDTLYYEAKKHGVGGILATPVRDTMKRTNDNNTISTTVDRNKLWHALTPQMFPLWELQHYLRTALEQGKTITDEASAFELNGKQPLIVQGRGDNIKITQPEDLALAEFYLANIYKRDQQYKNSEF